MTNTDKISFVKTLVDDPTVTSDVIGTYLTLAESKIIERAYPFVEDKSTLSMPKRYEILQCELAAYMIQKRGAEYQKVSIENGIHRNYGSAGYEDILSNVVPHMGVV